MEATPRQVDSAMGADTRCQYRPQFSAASSFILSRMSSGSSSPSPSTRCPADSNSAMIPTTTPPTIDQNPSAVMPAASTSVTAAAGIKRKRDAVDYTQNTISFPPSASRIKPCSRCRRQTISPAGPPRLSPSTSSSSSSSLSSIEPFFCADCIVSEDVATQRATNLASAMPHGVPCVSADLIGFPAGTASDSALTNYFYKRKPDLLNILSFCDQLRPQLLIDVLVSVARRHPHFPMFDSPDWNTEPPSPVPPSSLPRQRREHARPRHGHVVPESKARRGHKSSKSLKAPPALLPDEAVEKKEEEEEVEERDSLPPTWPRAGNGLYARLAAEEEDRSFLLDDNDEEAFSHFGVDGEGKQIALAVCG